MQTLKNIDIQATVLDLIEDQAFPSRGFGQNVLIFGGDTSSSIHIIIRKKIY